MKVLAVESSCDETAVAIVENGWRLHSNVIASQADMHALYGGVVPELASRRHSELIFPMMQEALDKAHLTLDQIDLIAATHSPGLLGALLIGLQSAKGLALGAGKPFIGVHHIEAHLYSAWMSHLEILSSRTAQSQIKSWAIDRLKDYLPALGLVISGGHTLVVRIEAIGRYELLSRTLDDAIGEAFDKVGVMLGLPYPGGAELEKLAKRGDPSRYPFKSAQSKTHPGYFSYSGLKTQLLHAIWGGDLKAMQGQRQAPHLSDQQKADLAASFQKTVIDDLAQKLLPHAQDPMIKSLWVGGGVSANLTLRSALESDLSPLPILWPTRALCVDNAAMIGGLAYHQYLSQPFHTQKSRWDLPAVPRSPLPSWLV